MCHVEMYLMDLEKWKLEKRNRDHNNTMTYLSNINSSYIINSKTMAPTGGRYIYALQSACILIPLLRQFTTEHHKTPLSIKRTTINKEEEDK